MSPEDFSANLTVKFKDKKDDERNRLFFDDLVTFTNKCLEIHLQDVYNWITVNHQYSTPFNMYKIYDYAESKGYIPKKQTSKNTYWNVCDNCKCNYSKEGRGCPKCRSTKSHIKTGESLPEYFVDVKEDCYYCDYYKASIKKENERKLYFTNCGDYGIKQDPKCSACQCKECCRQMMMYNADNRGTIEKYHTTELAQPWLTEVQPLNKTVEQITRDIARRNK